MNSYFLSLFTAKTFKNITTASISAVKLNTLVFQDDIAKMNDNLGQARDACTKIDIMLKRQQLSVDWVII